MGQRIYEREKDKQIQIGTDLIDKEFQQKLSNLNIEQKISISAKTNESRLKRMKARNECLEMMKEEAKNYLI